MIRRFLHVKVHKLVGKWKSDFHFILRTASSSFLQSVSKKRRHSNFSHFFSISSNFWNFLSKFSGENSIIELNLTMLSASIISSVQGKKQQKIIKFSQKIFKNLFVCGKNACIGCFFLWKSIFFNRSIQLMTLYSPCTHKSDGMKIYAMKNWIFNPFEMWKANTGQWSNGRFCGGASGQNFVQLVLWWHNEDWEKCNFMHTILHFFFFFCVLATTTKWERAYWKFTFESCCEPAANFAFDDDDGTGSVAVSVLDDFASPLSGAFGWPSSGGAILKCSRKEERRKKSSIETREKKNLLLFQRQKTRLLTRIIHSFPHLYHTILRSND